MDTFLCQPAFAGGLTWLTDLSSVTIPFAAIDGSGDIWVRVGWLALTLFLILVNAFFVAAEFALVKVRPTLLDELAARGGSSARKAQYAVAHLDSFISATQLGVTATNLALGWIGEPAVSELLYPLFVSIGLPQSAQRGVAFLVAFIIVTFMTIVFGELAPKTIAIRKSQSIVLAIAWPLHIFYYLFRWPIFALNKTANAVVRLLGIKPATEAETAPSPGELAMIVQGSARGGQLAATQAAIASDALDLHERTARDVMIPRVDMAYLTTADSFEQNVMAANEAGYTRYPLCDPDADHVIGMVHIRDLLAVSSKPGASIRDARRDILVVPETKTLVSLLRMFQSSRIHMALVLDEFGGTAGIVTLEDVLEEIVGDIQDEYQHERPAVETRPDGGLTVDGGLILDDLARDHGITLESEEADTVAGYVQWKLGAVPELGQEVISEGYILRVEAMEGRRVRRVAIEREKQAV